MFYAMPVKNNITRYSAVLTVLMFFIMCLSFWQLQKNADRFRASTRWVEHSDTILYKSEQLLTALSDIGTGARGYLLSHDEKYLIPYKSGRAMALILLDSLSTLTRDNPLQYARVDSLHSMTVKRIGLSDEQIRLRQGSHFSLKKVVSLVGEANLAMDGLRRMLFRMQSEEQKILFNRRSDNEVNRKESDRIVFVFAAGMVFLSVFLTLILSSLEARRKNAKMIEALNMGLEQRVEERSRELLAQEHRFRETLDNMLEGAQIIGFDWRYLYVNDSMAKHGRYSKEELIGYTVMEKYPGIEKVPIYQTYLRCFKDRVAIHLENEFQFPDGSIGWFELSFQPVPEGIFILSMDITERIRAQEEILKLNRGLEAKVAERTAQLELTNKELEAFSYSVSHDLRAPLRGIDGWSLALWEDYGGQLDDRAKEYLQRVRSETQRMGLLIDDMLQLSQVSRSQIKLSELNLSLIVQAIIERLQESNPVRVVEFETEKDMFIKADAHLIEIAMTNLYSNAFKFSAKNSHAKIQLGRKFNGTEWVYFVKDNGVGFDIGKAQKLFGAFQRFHRQSEFPGTGIGLATVQRIIHLHGGRIWADAKPGEGACFHFTIHT